MQGEEVQEVDNEIDAGLIAINKELPLMTTPEPKAHKSPQPSKASTPVSSPPRQMPNFSLLPSSVSPIYKDTKNEPSVILYDFKELENCIPPLDPKVTYYTLANQTSEIYNPETHEKDKTRTIISMQKGQLNTYLYLDVNEQILTFVELTSS